MTDYRLPNEPGRYIDVRTDEEQRYHFRHDTQASTFNVYSIALPPFINEPGLLAETFEAALTTLARLRSQRFVPLYPPDVWQPMGIIVATSLDVVIRDVAIRLALMEGGTELTDDDLVRISSDPRLHENGRAQEQRVAALYRALALMRGAPLPSGTMEGWKGLTTLQ
jgi:hypothetical protein